MASHILKGSEREPVKGARAVGKADPAERLEVSMLLRHRASDALHERIKGLHKSGQQPEHLKREDFAQQFGADPADIEAVKKFAKGQGLAVVQESPSRRTVTLAGTVAQFNHAFGVDLERFEHEGGSYRGRMGAVKLPDELKERVEGVFGLDDRQQATPHFRNRLQGNIHWRASSTSFKPTQLASLYNFPAGNGHGECIGII
jgi:kumamolisin